MDISNSQTSVNRGPNDADGLGWEWAPLNDGKPIAAGAAPANKVQFGDIDGQVAVHKHAFK